MKFLRCSAFILCLTLIAPGILSARSSSQLPKKLENDLIDNVIIDLLHFTSPDYKDGFISFRFKKEPAKDPLKRYGAMILHKNSLTGKLEPIYHTSLTTSSIYLLKGDLTKDGQDEAILYTVEGSGAFLSYKVVSWIQNKPVTLWSKDHIFQGTLRFDKNRLYERTGHQETIYEMKGEKISVSEPEKETKLSSTKTIEYSIDDKENVKVSDMAVKLNVGETLQLRRMNRGIKEKILLSSKNDNIVIKDTLYTAKKRGTATITIVPGGYTWSKAVKITVIVE
jgi:hypothetical protein